MLPLVQAYTPAFVAMFVAAVTIWLGLQAWLWLRERSAADPAPLHKWRRIAKRLA